MNPHRLAWGFAYSLSFAQLIGLKPCSACWSAATRSIFLPVVPSTVSLFLFILWMNATSVFAIHFDHIKYHWSTFMMVLLITLVELGANPKKITALRNGVDLEFFRPTLRDETRTAMQTGRHLLLSVGNLVPFKGHDIAIRALARLQDTHLNIIGEGSERQALQELASGLDMADRVTFLGNLPQSELPRHYSAAVALILASSCEGWANVLLEAMACGTPVVATRVGGNPEVVAATAAGQLMDERTTEALIVSLRKLFAPNLHAMRPGNMRGASGGRKPVWAREHFSKKSWLQPFSEKLM